MGWCLSHQYKGGGEDPSLSCGTFDVCGGVWEGEGEFGRWFSGGVENGGTSLFDIFGAESGAAFSGWLIICSNAYQCSVLVASYPHDDNDPLSSTPGIISFKLLAIYFLFVKMDLPALQGWSHHAVRSGVGMCDPSFWKKSDICQLTNGNLISNTRYVVEFCFDVWILNTLVNYFACWYFQHASNAAV